MEACEIGGSATWQGGSDSWDLRFNIVARAGGTPSRNDIHLMLRSLLNDRFKFTGRVIVAGTGLTGRFDYELTWTPQALDADAASFFTAVREQLGLRLEATKHQSTY